MTEQPQQPHQPQDGRPTQPPQPGYGYPQQPQPGYQQSGYPSQGYQDPGYQQAGYQQPGYQQPAPMPAGYPTGDPNAPYGYDPFGRPYSDKSKIVAGILQLTLGTLGIGRFYMGNVGIGLAQLFTCGGLGIWALIDGIMILVGNDTTDDKGRILRG